MAQPKTPSVFEAMNDVIEDWNDLLREKHKPITTERDILVRQVALAFRELRNHDRSGRGEGVPVSADAVARYGYERALDDARDSAGT